MGREEDEVSVENCGPNYGCKLSSYQPSVSVLIGQTTHDPDSSLSDDGGACLKTIRIRPLVQLYIDR